MIAVVGSTQTGEFLRIRHPVEVAAINNNSTHLTCSTIHIFSGTVRHNVGAPFERAAVDGCSESIVHNEWHAVTVRYACELLYVEHGASGIADGFAEYKLGVRAESLLNFLFAVVGIHESALYAELLQCHAKQIERATINLVARHYMVACLTDIEHRVKIGSLAAARQHRSYSTFKLRNLLCHDIIGRVLETGVEISFLLQVEEHCHLLRVVILERGALNDWRFYRLAVLCLIASLHADGGSS